ncbi:MAG: acetyl-CoA carboxylase biotin carboxyl carrier protein subunit [Alphaproteobacteria bacterium]|nr:acetyl-CoA carboxylase biotin carboxyl carrier protein subunit [Alphaproteobacteria bacterium]
MAKRANPVRSGAPVTVVTASCRSRNAYDLKVVALAVEPDDKVEAGQILATLEYYKIATEITAPITGRVARLCVKLDDEVQVGEPLIDLTPL